MNRAAAVAAGAAIAAANIWPGISQETAQEFTRVGAGLPVSNPNKFMQRHERYYHVLDYATTGHTQLTFFQAQASDGVCNLTQGEVPTERPMWLTGLCVTFQDLTAAGARSGAQASASAITSLARAEEIRSILQAGLVKIWLADRVVHEGQDLTKYPSDGGFNVGAAGISFAAATASSYVFHSNGVPVAGNRFRLPAPVPILPGKRVKVDLLWQQLLTITAAGRIKVELVGESVQALNL